KWISGIFIIIFVVISVLIISNTIKLTVYARRKEINIMKYIGASDWFIRWPFVIEGLVTGIIGSMIALIATLVVYNYLAEYSAGFMTSMAGQLQIAPVKDMALNLALYYSMLGVLVGVLGSALSMRKYLRV
ncbi:MAG: FtsX-like permease family protein, partial [Eubacteriales bacterium]|nr:FtsX-like permease family protein [Eubacteriales bacterium]